MARLSSLPPPQRAVLSLVLERGKTYDEIATLLHIGVDAVRDRAHQALAGLAPPGDAAPPPERRRAIGDYLLGQAPDRAAATLAELRASAADRAWARALAAELGALADGRLPEIPGPGEAAAVPPPSAPEPTGADTNAPPPSAPEPSGADTSAPPPSAREPTGAAPAAAAPPPSAPEPTGADPAAIPPPPESAPAPPVATPPLPPEAGPEEREAEPPGPPKPAVSRRGGALLILGAAVAIAAVVAAFLLLRGGPTHRAKPAAAAAPQASVAAQIALKAAPGVGAQGIAAVIKRGGQRIIAIAAGGLRPTSARLAYGVWLYNTGADAQLVGFVPPVKADGKISAAAPLPATAARFHMLVLTREGGTHATRPGQVILSGALPAGAAG